MKKSLSLTALNGRRFTAFLQPLQKGFSVKVFAGSQPMEFRGRTQGRAERAARKAVADLGNSVEIY